ncbi:hypothetical protein M3G15_20995 [Paenibacillus sp. p3-SID1389]|uniref:hypothetical protein n=1 Tax=Paenibacillus sp. p3-SID1389 TaxID=2916364 RepID=UPI0021A4C657|nr:hypothetical protein [Paenibacillus sp. p3-SID1389]MCT2197591.1 hypothetical protein [Paenibacillus sp. p3-SID1389]
MKFTSIRKKTRGMKKKARKLASWAEHHKQLDIESLLKHRKEYVKIWIKPFYNLYQINSKEVGKKNPTYKFRKQIFYQLIEIYLAWQEKLEQLNQPYYLKIWLADPEFIDSQVVAALGTEIEYYNKIFMDNEVHKEFPLLIHHPSTDKFLWERCVNGYYVWESDLETTKEINDIQNRALKTDEVIIDGRIERSYFINTGDMWTGSIQRSGNIT